MSLGEMIRVLLEVNVLCSLTEIEAGAGEPVVNWVMGRLKERIYQEEFPSTRMG